MTRAPLTGGDPAGIFDAVIAFVTRIVSMLALVAAVLWVALPAAVVASANAAHAEGEACPCCEGQATPASIVACPSCPASTPDDGALPLRYMTVTAAWLGLSATSATGIDPAPAEPPPR
ncbi:hypothetical protein [Reyranella sp.]|uniref:hypothetical protein n=1 Tax=Reyranella sp. TaxID=1929291 RepID=UPI0012285EBD|nr:hypothetical protein [Reyranella sp.]TAJ84670.1 MAG: hypothetical protein EPO50_18485 [Reyranella sp.]